ncbi:uncharacterized protein LOC106523837 [Austrofundulus limnaeus]|uniref:Uncharacterized protein LOC106523837 n=1 Tax=Austrofundulus limnaeus TaxID=52670 RepID=A0A2I4BYP1_AUSLI|nr:PREDICTED: uncharacterized protein LOC106523837 [Austrofundulus limnaeus]
MPNRGKARDVCVASQKKLFTLKGSQLYAKIVRIEFSMAPFEFYKSLMEMIEFKVSDDKERTIYIRNISPSEVRNLREELKKIQSVKNVFPLLNKVFVEFENARDADRIGVWYSLQKHSPPHNIFRMRVPWSTNVAMAPRLAAKALPDAKDLVTGAVVPTTNCGVPKGSKPPFSVTLTTYPFVFPTVSPWFIIPNFVTAELKCQNWRYFMETKHPMVMLTGLPSGNYKHKDVVKLVWQYLPKQNLQCLYYNVLVLPLQRRAFVFFKDRQSCCSFVEDYLKNPVPVEGHVLDIHIVKQVVDPGSTEESMYRTLMKWSNSHVPDLESLQERLVIVELSETSVSLIIAVMKSVTQVAPFVSFLPLANRICIEMTESSGVTRVIKKIQSQQWSKVRHAESSKSLNQRIQQFGEISVNLDLENYVLTLNPIKATTHKPEPPLAETADVQEAAAESKGPSSAAQMPQICNEKTELAAAKTIDVPSELAGSEKQPDAPVKVQDSEVVPAETVKVESKEAKPSELMETAVTEQTELEGSVETKAETTAETKPLQTKPSESQTTPTPAPSTDPQRPQTTFKPQETPAKSSSEVQKSLPNSDTTHLKPKTDTSQKQQQTAEESGPVSEKSQTSEINEASSAKEVAAGSSELDPNQQSATVGNETTANETTSAPVVVSTPEENSQNFQTITKNIQFLSLKNILLPKFLSKEICLIVTNLPEYNDGSYTESSIINLLRKFGLEFEDDSVFIAPQYQTAFVCQPHVRKVQEFFKRPISNNRTLNGSKLCFQVFCVQKYTLFGFYTFFMNVTSSKRKHTSSSVVYIKNISSSEATDLRIALKKIGDVTNYVPLLNKVFVEFSNPCDADRLGVWYSFLKQRLPHSVHRTGLPSSFKRANNPRLPLRAMPHRNDIVAWAKIPRSMSNIPKGTTAPFWITMTTSPYLFSTERPWFNIPDFSTINEMRDILLIKQKKVRFPTIMLTGLPTATYTHKDLAKLVWKYFPEQNLYTLHNNVIVLPLQRRAFVHFDNWDACFRFLTDHVSNQVCLKDCVLSTHVVLNDVIPRSDEESMYRSLMKLSNIHVSDLKSLEDRLLCVEVLGTSERLVSTVMTAVASFATFVSFLPLSNWIYVEMAESSGVTKVLENMSVCRLPELSEVWKLVGRVELLKTRKQRLKDSKKIAVNVYLSLGTTDAYTVSTHEKSSAQPPLNKEEPKLGCSAASAAPVPSAGSEVSESTTAMEEERCETEVTANSSVVPETDVETSEKEEAEPVSCSALQTGSPPLSENVPQMNMREFNALKAVILQFKQSHNPTKRKEAQEDTEVHSSKLHVEPDSNFQNSVTVDEMTEDMEDKDTSESKQTAEEKPEEQSSDMSSKTFSSTSSNSSVSTSSTSDPNKPQTEPSSSVLSDTSSSESVETLRAQSSSAALRTSEQESHQKLSEDNSATKTVESQVETLSEVEPEQKFIPQTQSLETRDETPEEKDEEDKNTKETEDIDQILDTLDKKSVEQIKKEENQETETPGPEKDLLVSDSVKDETCSETNMDASAEVTDDSADEALNQEETHLVKDEGSTVKPDLMTGSQTEDGEDKKPDEMIPVPETPLQRNSTGAKNNQKTSQEATDNMTIVTRSTRKRKMTEKKDSDERKESETPTRTNTPGRDRQDAPTTEEKTPPGDVALTENTKDTNELELKTSEDFRENEEDNKAATPRPRGRPKTTTKLSPVATRISTRGVKAEDTDGQECVEEDQDGTGINKRRLELEEPKPKRSCSQSPHFGANFKLPPFDPKTPLGKEFVSRKWGFFCNLCSVSFLNENTTEDQHCKSQTHSENLQRYKKKRQQLRQKLQPTRMSTRISQKLI